MQEKATEFAIDASQRPIWSRSMHRPWNCLKSPCAKR